MSDTVCGTMSLVKESLLESHPLSLHDMVNDDALSLHELLARYPDMDDDTKNLVRAAFHKIDVNADGVVQRKEIEALLDEADALDEKGGRDNSGFALSLVIGESDTPVSVLLDIPQGMHFTAAPFLSCGNQVLNSTERDTTGLELST